LAEPVDYAIDIQRDRRGVLELASPHLAGAVITSQCEAEQRNCCSGCKVTDKLRPTVSSGHDERHWFVAAVPGRSNGLTRWNR
jgi:hypothetical protein